MLKRLLQRLAQTITDRSWQRDQSAPQPDTASLRERACASCREAIALIERSQLDAAEGLLHEAIELKYDFAEAHFQLGRIYRQRGQLADAADCQKLAVHFDPGHVPAHYALATLHKSQGRHAKAAEHYLRITELSPQDSAAHTNLCLALYETGVYDQARQHGERAIGIDPQLPEAHHNLALVLREVGDPERAVQHFQKAFDLTPRAEIAAGLANAFRDLGRLDEAIAMYDRALQLNPDLGDAAINRAYAYLSKEDYSVGWAHYEGRFSATGTKVRDFGLPRWNGEALRGRTILVHAEQGLGDEIMFASCLPDLIEQAERVIIECSDRLEPLICRSFPQAMVHGGRKEDPEDWIGRFAPVHYQVPIGSLPRWFRRDRAAFHQAGRYLLADYEAANDFRSRIGAGRKPVIGLSWRGGTPKTRSHLRSIPLELFTPLFNHDAIFVSLQHGTERSELSKAAGAVRTIEGVTDSLDRLAALISALDLVVSIDNTNVHLAGAIGRPVWALLSASPDWRYGLSGETTPWYPSAKLFRQGDDRRWEPIIKQVTVAFSAWSERTPTAE